jgi:hypothetical protein
MYSLLKCILCNNPIIGDGHNPEPLASSNFKCCKDCNNDVILYRLYKAGIKYTGIKIEQDENK